MKSNESFDFSDYDIDEEIVFDDDEVDDDDIEYSKEIWNDYAIDLDENNSDNEHLDITDLEYTSTFTPVSSASKKAKNKRKRKEEKKEKTKQKNEKMKKKRKGVGWGVSLLAIVGLVGLNLLIDSMPY